MIEKDNKIILKQSIKVNILCLIGCLCFVVGCLLLKTRLNIFNGIIVFLSILFFLIGFIFFLVLIIRKNKVLVIVDKNGITDLSSFISLGFISWSDIENIEIKEYDSEAYFNNCGINIRKIYPGIPGDVLNSKFINISLKNEENYLNSVSAFKRKIIDNNNSHGFGIVNLNLSLSDVDLEEFYKKLIEYRDNRR